MNKNSKITIAVFGCGIIVLLTLGLPLNIFSGSEKLLIENYGNELSPYISHGEILEVTTTFPLTEIKVEDVIVFKTSEYPEHYQIGIVAEIVQQKPFIPRVHNSPSPDSVIPPFETDHVTDKEYVGKTIKIYQNAEDAQNNMDFRLP